MRLNLLIGGQAGQGVNKISDIITNIIMKQGYFTFNYRDYPSLIRGGHNFNVISISDERIGSFESKLDGIIALNEKTLQLHKNKLKKGGFILTFKEFEDLGKNINISLAGALMKVLGIDKKLLIEKLKEELYVKGAVSAAEKGYQSQEVRFKLKKLNNKVSGMTGTQGIVQGAINSGIDFYFAYPMTPATGVLHELAGKAKKGRFKVFQSGNEIEAVNAALGASFAGARVMVGTSGGGFDLMTEALSFQGQSEIPLTIYLASRPGPGTGVPTYTAQSDLDIALRGGHGEFPRVVIAPGDPTECIEKTNEAIYLAEKFGALSVILSDKHLAESEFSSDRKPNKPLQIEIKRKIPGKSIVKASGYEHLFNGDTTENAEITRKNAEKRLKKYEEIKKEVKKFEMVKVFGNKNSKNLIIGWGSSKTVILDAISGLDWKFLQVLYLKPLSDEIKKEMEKARKVVVVEGNVTGQLGRLIREKTGIKIENRILKYDSRPFLSDKLREELKKKK